MTTSDSHYEVRIKTTSGGRHRMTIKAVNEIAARKEAVRWCRENEKKWSKIVLWEVPMLPGTGGT